MSQPLIFGRQRQDRRAADLEQRLAGDMPLSPNGTRPGADPATAQGRSRLGLHRDGLLVFGRVVDYVAYVHMYKVQCERGLGTVRCCDAVHTGLGVVGPRQLGVYPPGTAVLVLYHPQALHHVIVCAVPDWAFDARSGLSDMVAQGSNVGLQVDAAHRYPFLAAAGGGVIDFSAGRPADSLAGDWGVMSELGVGVFADSVMAYLRADEETGVFAWYMDQMLRVAGRNLQVRSAGHEREDLDDESEFSSYHGYTPYTWEALGVYDALTAAALEQSALDAQQNLPTRGRLEPAFDDQLAIHRERHFHGYLGQGGKRTWCVPRPPAPGAHRYSDPAATLVGVAEETVGLDGAFGLRSVHSVVLAKMPLVPTPKRRARPESLSGDRAAANYRSCGLYGAGPFHEVQSAPANANPEPHLVEASALFDEIAYLFNWKGNHPFHYRPLDWYLPNDAELEQYPTVATNGLAFNSLSSQQFLPQAPGFTVEVDERYGLAQYYANASAIALLPGGGISIVDGWGSEIRLVGGHIYTHAAGDQVRTAGRNVVDWAGWDHHVKANNCAEVVANRGSVRVKAEDKVMIAGGNDGCGGVLIESLATQPSFDSDEAGEDVISGVVIRAKNSVAAITARDVYVATDLWGEAGRVIIDAGDNAIITKSNQFRRHILEAAFDIFSNTVVNEYWPGQTRIDNNLVVNGTSHLWGCVATPGDLVAGGNVIAGALRKISSDHREALVSAGETIADRDLTEAVIASDEEVEWLPDKTSIADLEFYFRDSAAMLAAGFKIHEPVWHQLARYNGVVMPVWTEQTIGGDVHDESASYPGKEVWDSLSVYGLQPLTLFDANNTACVARGAAYETPALGATDWVGLGAWPVVANP